MNGGCGSIRANRSSAVVAARWEDAVNRFFAFLGGWTLVILTTVAAAAQPADVYAGRRLTVLVGVEAGGTIDTLARAFAAVLRRHIPGSPTIVIQNMPGAGGATATNYLHERAAA